MRLRDVLKITTEYPAPRHRIWVGCWDKMMAYGLSEDEEEEADDPSNPVYEMDKPGTENAGKK